MKKSKYTIAYFIDGLGWGGAERMMLHILANLNKDLFSPYVGVFNNKQGNPVADELVKIGIPVELIPIRYLRDLSAPRRTINYLQKVKADIVHNQLEYANIYGGWAANKLRIPSVSTMHTIAQKESNVKLWLHQELEFFFLRKYCSMVISVSAETRRSYRQEAKISDEKSCIIYNGINLTHYKSDKSPQADREAVLKQFGIPPTSNLLMTVAVLREPKGIQYMLHALPEVLKAHPNTYYMIVGDGDYKEELMKQTNQLGIRNQVIFTGTRNDIPNLMSFADLFILPSLTEALPTVLAEAMAASVPILATHVGGIPEMIQENVNGRLVPPKDVNTLSKVCIEMLSNPQQLHKLGDEGRKLVEGKFNIHTQIDQLQNLYIQMISHNIH